MTSLLSSFRAVCRAVFSSRTISLQLGRRRGSRCQHRFRTFSKSAFTSWIQSGSSTGLPVWYFLFCSSLYQFSKWWVFQLEFFEKKTPENHYLVADLNKNFIFILKTILKLLDSSGYPILVSLSWHQLEISLMVVANPHLSIVWSGCSGSCTMHSIGFHGGAKHISR